MAIESVDMTNKRVMVTGCTAGLGRAAAIALAAKADIFNDSLVDVINVLADMSKGKLPKLNFADTADKTLPVASTLTRPTGLRSPLTKPLFPSGAGALAAALESATGPGALTPPLRPVTIGPPCRPLGEASGSLSLAGGLSLGFAQCHAAGESST